MNTIINTAKFKADEKLEKYVNEKVAKLDRMTDRATKCEVFLKIDKPESDNNKIAELQLALPGQTLFIAKQADTFQIEPLPFLLSLHIATNSSHSHRRLFRFSCTPTHRIAQPHL